jgi:hypothetical protein
MKEKREEYTLDGNIIAKVVQKLWNFVVFGE